MRLAVRNFLLPPPEAKGSGEGTSILPRRASIWEYESSDQRDRSRSTLLDKPNTCEYIVGLDVRDPAGWPGPEHLPTIHHFGERWLAAGNYLPPDFDNPTGEPLSAEDREYQEVRGEGGRSARHQISVAKPAKSARKAEPGDQQIVTDPNRVMLQMLDRFTREGRVVEYTTAHDQALARLERGGFFWRS